MRGGGKREKEEGSEAGSEAGREEGGNASKRDRSEIRAKEGQKRENGNGGCPADGLASRISI